MTSLELLEAYPKAAAILSQFYQKKLIDSMNTEDVPEDYKEVLRQQTFDNQYVAKFVHANPRILFDVFDENGFFIETLYMEGKFHYTIVNDGEVTVTEPQAFDTRIECDRSAIEAAMKLLND